MSELQFEFSEKVGVALSRNGGDLVNRAVYFNDDKDLSDVSFVLSSEPQFFQPVTVRYDSVAAGAQLGLVNNLEIELDLDYIATLESPAPSKVTLEVRTGDGNVVVSATARTEVLAYNWWPSAYMPESVAAFITPSADILSRIRALASDILTKWGVNSSLSAYQSDNNHVFRMAAAVYEAIRSLGPEYVIHPIDFEAGGQRLRLPVDVMEKMEGNCIDLTCLYCSVLESIGLNTVVFVTSSHAFAGVWLVDDHCPDAVSTDPSRFTRAIRNNELRAVECTMMTRGSVSDFTAAIQSGLSKLDAASDFAYAVDVASARSTVLPLPTRVMMEGRWVIERPAKEADASAPKALGEIYADPVARRATRVDYWKRELLDTGSRNSLISMKPGTKVMPLMVADCAGFEDSFAEGAEFSVFAKPQTWEGTSKFQCKPFEPDYYMGSHAQAARGEVSRGWIRTPYTEKETENACRNIFRASVHELEESGCNALFLGIGILRWSESPTTRPHYSPLILVPAEMKKKSTGYVIRRLEQETVFNVTLAELLRQEFSVEIPGIDPLPEDDSGVNVDQILQTVRRAVSGMEGWEVLGGVVAGVFTFSQYAMWKDLDSNLDRLTENEVVHCLVDGTLMSGPQELEVSADPYGLCLTVPADGSQIRAVRAAGEGRSFVMHGPPGTGKSQTITNIISDSLYRGKTVLFVAEKRAALEVVEKRLDKIGIGHHCLELHSNKTEKYKVLDQLKASLEACKAVDESKLPALMADIEKQKASLDSYVSALHQPAPWGVSAYECISRLERFNGRDLPEMTVPERYVRSLLPETSGEFVEKVSRAIRIYASVRDMDNPVMEKAVMETAVLGIDDDVAYALDEGFAASKRLEDSIAALSATGIPVVADDPASAIATVDAVLAVPTEFAFDRDLEGMAGLFEALAVDVSSLEVYTKTLYDYAQYISPSDIESKMSYIEEEVRGLSMRGYRSDNARALLSEFRHVLQLRHASEADARTVLDVWKPAAIDSGRMITSAYETAAAAGFFSRKKARKGFIDCHSHLMHSSLAEFDNLRGSVSILPTLSDRVAEMRSICTRLVDSIRQVVEEARRYASDLKKSAHALAIAGVPPGSLPAIRSRIETSGNLVPEFREAVSAFAPAMEALRSVLCYAGLIRNTAEFHELYDTVSQFRGRYFDWASWNVCRMWFRNYGMDSVIAAISSDSPVADIIDGASRALYKAMFNLSRQTSETLRLFSSESFEADIDHFRQLDNRVTTYNRNLLKYRLYSNTPRNLDSSVAGTEAALLYRAVNSTRMRKSIRQLISEIPNVLPKVCPCLLMSPQSVAQYITHDFPKFDIVIFDESSQIVTSKAIGALGRAKAAVVAGDNKQLPPTSFFQKKVEAEEEDAIDVESFLDDCLGARMPQTYLEWHYRSRHESLIGFSNNMFYENRMLTFPSPDDSVAMVSLRRVGGLYERGARCNVEEARAVAAEIRRRVLDPGNAGRSIGVIAFSISQQTAIEDIVDDMEDSDRAFSKGLSNLSEPLFIKNLETVQGDERDIILFSIGYGPGPDGGVFQNFGPINRAGGGRRLNVAVSRARTEMVVFSSMSYTDVKVTPTSSTGVRALREFLRYAANGGRIVSNESGSRAGPSDIMVSLASVLKAKGYECRYDVGSSEFRVDLAITDPRDSGRYLLGILGDGDSYCSSENTRDREYARADVLENLGWRIMHVWSVDWYFRRERVTEAVINRIHDIIRETELGLKKEEKEVAPEDPDFGTTGMVEPEKHDVSTRREDFVPFKTDGYGPFFDQFDTDVVLKIGKAAIAAEAPLAENQLMKLFARSVGLKRLVAARRTFLESVFRQRFKNTVTDGFITYWKDDQDPGAYDSYRVPVNADDARDIECIPLEEILSAIRDVVETSGSFEADSAARVVSSAFGFSRAGEKIREYVDKAMAIAVERGIVVLENGRYRKP